MNKLYNIALYLNCFLISTIIFSQEKISPERFINLTQSSDQLYIECNEGFVELKYYNENIVHFLFYPKYTNEVNKSWGIQPSTKVIKPLLKKLKKGRYDFTSKKMNVNFSTLTGEILFQSKEKKTFLKTGNQYLSPSVVQGQNTYSSYVSFEAPENEHYYGLGQHQSGWLDHKGKQVPLWHDYEATDGEVIAIPFLLTNNQYAVVFDNPSKTIVDCGIDNKTTWKSEVAPSISYYIIHGETTNEIYRNYGELCGFAPLPPKKALGYIQCKQKYKTQDEVLKVARKHKQKGYPLDYMVVDWFHWNTLGDLDLNSTRWPDASEMNRELKQMNVNTMISCWPRFKTTSTNFDILNKNGWLMRNKNGTVVNGTAWDNRGGLIDSTNPEASQWFWSTIRKNYVSKGFDSFWLDESEPDIIPHNFVLHEGMGSEIYNLYPLLHAKGLYEGHRKDFNTRVFSLTRSAYLGAHKYGTSFWSSDIDPEWDVLKRQLACGVNFCASGMPYWSSDIGGWQPFDKERDKLDTRLLITSNVGPKNMYRDYPEMYVRWFQLGAFCPTFRAHGTRSENEVWSYGEEVEKILVNHLKLRYKLMPYIYTGARIANTQNYPIMRGLFLDFMNDDKVSNIKDSFMFGPSLLVAPVLEPGIDKRKVYLPKGQKWFNFYTNRLVEGGKTISTKAPIDKIPLFVKEGSIIPKARDLKQANQKIKELDIFVYPGKDAKFNLYSDDGVTYGYEKGDFQNIEFSWNNASSTLRIRTSDTIKEEMKFNIYLVKANSSNVVYGNDTNSQEAKTVVFSEQEIVLELN